MKILRDGGSAGPSAAPLHADKAHIFEVIQVNPAESQEALFERAKRNRVTVLLILSMARQRMSSCPIRPNSTIVGRIRSEVLNESDFSSSGLNTRANKPALTAILCEIRHSG